MIRAVDLGMTIDAAAIQEERTGAGAGQALRRIDNRGMAGALMAGLAQEGRPELQERRLSGSVRIVAIGAILRNRLMLPQERSAKFRMTAGAGFGDGILDEQGGRSRTMG